MRLSSSICLIFFGCYMTSCQEIEPQFEMSECGMYNIGFMLYPYVDYNVITPDTKTPEGIPVDLGSVKTDLHVIDTMSNEVKECLIKNFPDLVLPQEVMDETYCIPSRRSDGDFSSSYNSAWGSGYGCWQVKFDNDWTYSCDGTEEVLSEIAPVPKGTTCGGKPKNESAKNCPCRYRMVIDGKTIVVTPNAKLFKDGLVRAVTGCANPWAHPLLSECASPNMK